MLLLAIVIQNLDTSTVLQLEELALLPADELWAQHGDAEIGWPIKLIAAEQHTFHFHWIESTIPVSYRILYVLIDVSLIALLPLASTKYLSECIERCGWRLTVSSSLAFAILYARFYWDYKGYFWHNTGIGTTSIALGSCVTYVVWGCVYATCYWIFARIGSGLQAVMNSKRFRPAS